MKEQAEASDDSVDDSVSSKGESEESQNSDVESSSENEAQEDSGSDSDSLDNSGDDNDQERSGSDEMQEDASEQIEGDENQDLDGEDSRGNKEIQPTQENEVQELNEDNSTSNETSSSNENTSINNNESENNTENEENKEESEEVVAESSADIQQVLVAPKPRQIERDEDGKIKGTRINKMVMNGFKSFAKHTEFVFEGDYNCVIGPNGSGKCVTGDTEVLLADGTVVSIKTLIDEKIKTNAIQEIDDGYIIGSDGTTVLSLDTKTLKAEPKKVKAFVKRTAPKDLVKIRTRSGREITSTTYHPLFTLTEKGLESVKAEELKEGITIAVPRKLPIAETTKYFVELLDDITPHDGLYVAYQDCFKEYLLNIKDGTWKQTAANVGIPQTAIKGLLDKQAINFSYLIRILRYSGLPTEEIMQHISKVKTKTSAKYCTMIWKNSNEFSRFLGYVLAEGRLSPDRNHVWFTNANEEIVKDYVSLVQTLFGIKAHVYEYKPHCYDVIIYSEAIKKLLSYFGMSLKGTAHKEVTTVFLTHAENEEIGHLLAGLYAGDGYIGKNTIEIVTKSKKLGKSIEYMLLRLGILFSSKYVVKTATNSGFEGIYKRINVYGTSEFRKFADTIPISHPEKRKRLESIVSKKANPNVDLIPTNALIKQISKELKISIKKTKKEFPLLNAYCYTQCTPSRTGIQRLLTDLFVPQQQKQGFVLSSIAQLESLGTSDIFWDEIVEIQKIESKEKWVYDLCVDEHHNFVANNIFVHNSNVLDALCFVLGKSSAKSLRAEKSANLIYNGGKSKKPAKQGEVSIFFDNKHSIFPTDAEEVKVSRIVRQNGQSIYKINDETRTRTEIVDLLSMARINPDGYNIILQGDIVKLVEMKPEERRELIGEIAGIGIYEEKKNKAVRELEKVDERLKETEIVLTERNTYLKELRKDRDQAMKYKDMNDNVKINKASYLKKQIDRKNAEQEDMQKQMDESTKELDSINEKISELKKNSEQRREEINEITREIETKGEIEQVKLNKDVEAMKIELTKKHARVEQLKTEIEKLKQRKADLKEGIQETEEKVAQIEAEKKTMQDEISKKKKEREVIATKIQKFKEKNNLDNLGDIESQIAEIDKKAEQFQKEAQEAREHQHDLIREKDKVSHEIGIIDQQMQKVLSIEKEHKKQIDDVNKKRDEFKKCTSELNKKLEEDTINASKLSEKRRSIVKSEEELSKLRARQISTQELSFADVAIKKISDLRKNNPKIYGTVAELGNVDSKHALALEIVAGNKIKSIVVEDDKTAAECIKLLKDKKLGVVTFLPLNKMKGKKVDKNVERMKKEKGCHGLAIDLVSFDAKFRSVFEYVFGDTIVVDSIDVVRKLGVGNAKFVTLDGDMAERSGAMQGGYRMKRKHSMGFKEKDIAEDISKLENEVSEMKSLIDVLEKRRIEDEELIARLRTTKAQLEGEIIKAEKSLHLDKGDLDASTNKKELLKKEDEDLDEKIRLIQDKISTINQELALVKTEKEKLRQNIAQLRNPTLIAELNAFEEKMQQLNEAVITIDSEIKVRDTQAAHVYQGELEKTHKIIKDIDKDSENFSNELDELQKTIKTEEADLNKKEEMAQEFYAKFKGLFHKRSEIDKAIQDNDAKVNSKLEKSRAIEIKVNTYSLKLADVKAVLAGLEQEFSQYEGVELDLEKTEEQLKNEIRKFEKMRDQIGSVNMRALEIYDEVEEQYNSLLKKKESLDVEKEDVVKLMEEIEGKKRELFLKTFDEVNSRFQEFFTKLTSKGAKAALVVENEDDPFEAGVRINVRISGSKFLDIRSLSGGEKTMTALAFIFAIQEYEPASFYVLDEVDAALDKHNAEKLAKLIQDYSKSAQYVVISHNDAVISEADILYGISMNEHGMSQVVSLKV